VCDVHDAARIASARTRRVLKLPLLNEALRAAFAPAWNQLFRRAAGVLSPDKRTNHCPSAEFRAVREGALRSHIGQFITPAAVCIRAEEC
jgi:hypothetical protein